MRVFFLLVLALFCMSARASESHLLAEQRNIIFDRLGTEDGLSQGIVTAFGQDDRGFIWIGTQEGLNRFDGFDFEHFYHLDSDPSTLSHDTIWTLLFDSSDRLWVGTDAGVNTYDSQTEEFELVPLGFSGAGEPEIHMAIEGPDGIVWLGTSKGIAKITSSGIVRIDKEAVGLSSFNVRALVSSDSGMLYVGTEANGLLVLDRENDTFSRLTHDRSGQVVLDDNHVRDLLIDSDENLWIATFNGGVSRLNLNTNLVKIFQNKPNDKYSLASNRIRSIFEDSSGNIWLGTDNGLNLWEPQRSSFVRYQTDLTDPRSLSDNSIQDIFQDSGGVIWVGTYNGVSKWNASVELFPFFKRSAGRGNRVPGDNITSFVEESNGDVWVGTLSGLILWDASEGELRSLHDSPVGLSDKRVMSLGRIGDEVWVGTMSGGINIVREGVVDRVLTHDPRRGDSLSSNSITRIVTDSKGRLWVGTYGAGVNLFLGGDRFRRFPGSNPDKQNVFSDLRTMDILERNPREIWISTEGGGIVILDPITGKTSFLKHSPEQKDSISSDKVFTLLETHQGVWIGTLDSGLNLYNPESGEVSVFTKEDGLASDAVYGLLEDKQGMLWVSSGRGLTRFDPENEKFTRFDSSHGLQSSDFNSGAYYKTSTDSLLFGGNNGFNAFYPSRIKLNSYVPSVRLTSFSIFNEKVLHGRKLDSLEQIELNYDDSVIGFEFAALDYTAPAKNQYRYKLEGFDKNWVEHGGNREVTYTNLDAGAYVFRVQGSNNDGVWNEQGASIPVIVQPAPWLTWWAYCIYFALAAVGFYFLLRINSDRLHREAERRYSERLQLYIESLEEASDCILIADSEGTLLYANNTISQGLNKSPVEVVGRPIFEVLFDDQVDIDRARNALDRDGRFQGEVELQDDKGESVFHEITIAAVHQSSGGSAYVGISRDVTDRKLTEAELEDYRRNLERLISERTQALQKEIAENKAIQVHLANSLKEKELLIKEVHHRVKNNMQVISSLLSIQAEGAGDDVYSTLLNESQQRIKSMALIHETLYQSEDLLKIDFQEYIESLTNSLSRSYSVPGVSVFVDVNVENVQLDLETAVPCGLIINELASNALKHAFVGKEGTAVIDIDFVSKECSYCLRIADNGVGLSNEFDVNHHSSMGMEIVAILTAQLEGELIASNDDGAVFEIIFPRRAHA